MTDNKAWVLDVLADLGRFAEMNGLPRFSGDLEKVAARVRSEIGGLKPAYGMEMLLHDLSGRSAGREAVAGEDA